MSLEDAARYWNQQLTAGLPINRVRVRRLLELAGAQRRGLVIVDKVRRTLEQYGLETEPDFESAWIEAQLRLKLRASASSTGEAETVASVPVKLEEGGTPALENPLDLGSEEPPASGSEAALLAEPLNSPLGSPGTVEVSSTPNADAQARFSSVPSANRGVVSVLLTDPIKVAITKMMLDGYSQVAIMQGEFQVRGIITWESIAKRFLLGPPPETVADCREDAQVIDSRRPLFDGIETIERYGYVLVRSQQQQITGIVTATDLLSEFGRLSYAFMSIRTIELLLRNKLRKHLQSQDFTFLQPHSRAREKNDSEFLTFGECVWLLNHPDIWERLSVRVDKALVSKRLDEIRVIRNEVMHFSPDPLDGSQKQSLEQMEAFMSKVFAE